MRSWNRFFTLPWEVRAKRGEGAHEFPSIEQVLTFGLLGGLRSTTLATFLPPLAALDPPARRVKSVSLEARTTLLFVFLCCTALACLTHAADPDPNKDTVIRYRNAKIIVDGRLDDPGWQQTPWMSDFEFPWWESGAKEATRTKMLWDKHALYIAFQCDDAHIWSEHLERDSDVFRDDCVELFVAPDMNQPMHYFNFEMNVNGALLDAHHPDGPDVKVDRNWNATGIQIATSFSGTLNNDDDLDGAWVLEVAIPFTNFSTVAKHAPPIVGDRWRLNLNRLGGKVNPQHSQWSPSTSPRPGFHAPQFFGNVTFANQKGGTEKLAVPLTTKQGWTTSRVVGTPDPPLGYALEQVFADVVMDHPTEFLKVPGTDRWMVVQQNGVLFSFSEANDRDVCEAIDLKGLPDGCLQSCSIAFAPDYPEKPYCYITYRFDRSSPEGLRMSRFRVSEPERPVIDPESEELILAWHGDGHTGGAMQFDADGFLFVSTGDASSPTPPDQHRTGQDVSDLEASVLRIDVRNPSGDLPYTIPADNPFVDLPGVRGEIWAFGFRNPWKMTIDPKTGSLWLGDVGWEMMEMIYHVERGGNYGWSIMEGSQVVNASGQVGPAPITPPAIEHTHVEALSITGGHFIDSSRLPELRDAYLYGDWMTGKIWALKHEAGNVRWSEELVDTDLRVICFARDDDGDVLVVGYEGTVHRLIENPEEDRSDQFPQRLSETGLFDSVVDETPAPGVVPYDINARAFADHTDSRQWIAVPQGVTLGLNAKDDWKTGAVQGDFDFPHGTVLAKTIFYRPDESQAENEVRLETQLLHRYHDRWNAYNYLWNESQDEAFLQDNVPTITEMRFVDEREPTGFRLQPWSHVTRDECLLCHANKANTVNGFKLSQLNRSDRVGPGNQLERLTASGVLSKNLLNHAKARSQAMVSPSDASADLAARARNYLHLNCAHCHRKGGGGTAAFHLVRDVPLESLRLLNEPVTKGEFRLQDAKVIAPGMPERSVLFYRMAKSGRGHMPMFGPRLVDHEGVHLMYEWIRSLSPSTDPCVSTEWIEIMGKTRATLSPELMTRLEATLASPETAVLLSFACGHDSVADEVRASIAAIACDLDQPGLRDLFEHFLPASQRSERLGDLVDADALLAKAGDVGRGRVLFHEAEGVSCRQCHRVAGKGMQVGPDLDAIAKERSAVEILQSILDPSAKVDAKYRGTTLLTVDGQVIAGLKTKESEELVEIVDAAGKRHRILQEDIEDESPMQKSMMPERLLADFTPQQAADLLAYLRSLK
ncbi:MAG: carbohydrate-binding family 9-like protein [Planctomycetota bacterium]